MGKQQAGVGVGSSARESELPRAPQPRQVPVRMPLLSVGEPPGTSFEVSGVPRSEMRMLYALADGLKAQNAVYQDRAGGERPVHNRQTAFRWLLQQLEAANHGQAQATA